MPDHEHTDVNALDELYRMPSGECARHVLATLPDSRWYARLWAWVREESAKEAVAAHPVPDPVARRIRVYRIGTRYARRLSRIDQGEARDILGVTAMLLGCEPGGRTTTAGLARRVRG